MQADQKASTNGHTPFAESGPDVRSELDELRTAYRRQALVIDTLRAAASRLRAGASALKEENADLRGEIERLHSHGPAPGA
jgi:hypothetical protein